MELALDLLLGDASLEGLARHIQLEQIGRAGAGVLHGMARGLNEHLHDLFRWLGTENFHFTDKRLEMEFPQREDGLCSIGLVEVLLFLNDNRGVPD